jgi:ribosome recycling factor
LNEKESIMIEPILKDAEKRMQKSIDNLKNELSKVRTGRAHPSLLDHVTVSYYGNDTPLSQVANVTVSDSRTLTITPWEKNMVQAIEKAIMTSDLGLNPATSGQVIRVPLPAMNEERRKEMTKVVRHEAENGRVSIRNIRRDAITHFKNLLKDKKITEDEERSAGEKAQTITDKAIKQIDQVVETKEKELMEV